MKASINPDLELFLKGLAEAIRLRRIKLDLSQEQLSERSQLNRSYIGRIEQARHSIRVETLLKIAEGLEMTLSALILRAEQEAGLIPRPKK